MTPDAHFLVRFLSERRFRLNTERVLQDEIQHAFDDAEIAHLREYRFPGSASIVDFMVGGTAIEVKIGGSKREIYRQCERYATHQDVSALILATTVSMALPDLAKPAFVVNLGRAWL